MGLSLKKGNQSSTPALICEIFSAASVDQKQLIPPRLVSREEAVLRGRRSASPVLTSSQSTAFQTGISWPSCMRCARSSVQCQQSVFLFSLFPCRNTRLCRWSARSTFLCLPKPVQTQYCSRSDPGDLTANSFKHAR